MPRGPVLPSLRQIQALAHAFGIELPLEDAETYRAVMEGTIKASRTIDELAELRPPVKYPRATGYRPSPAENPFNAWYWKTEIEGAGSGPLVGCRVGIKDMISVAGVPMMNGAPLLEGYMPDTDATVVTRLLDAGAVIAGKTSCSDHCFSSGGHTAAYGPVRNPRRPTAGPPPPPAGEGARALGADQGASIRIPAWWCGVVAQKPTYGLVPYTGCL